MSVTKESKARTKVPRAVREPQMLDAAVAVFAERGYHGASMDEIAAGAGVTKPMVYSYFGSKEDLYLACIDHAGTRLMEAVDEAGTEERDPERQLWLRLLAFFRFVGEHRHEWRVLGREAAATGGPASEQVARARRRVVQLVGRQIELNARARGAEVVPGGEPEILAQAMVGAGESLADWWLDHPEETAEAMAGRLMNVLWMGLGDLVEGRLWSPAAEYS